MVRESEHLDRILRTLNTNYWSRGSASSTKFELMRTGIDPGGKDSQLVVAGLGRTSLAQDSKALYSVDKKGQLMRLAK